MRLLDFEALIDRLLAEMPPEYLDGILGVEVSRHTLPHPERAEVYTLGECIPLPSEGGGDGDVRSRVVLYHGSFEALAAQEEGFDWRGEAWETLTHEIRHHLEWRARIPDLEAFDRAAEHNFARQSGEPFDPEFYLDGEKAGDQVYRIDDDFFLEINRADAAKVVQFRWHGAEYDLPLPAEVGPPAYITVTGLRHPPPGELVLVLRSRLSLRDLWKRADKRLSFAGEIRAVPRGDHP
jgi:hypothetical protein